MYTSYSYTYKEVCAAGNNIFGRTTCHVEIGGNVARPIFLMPIAFKLFNYIQVPIIVMCHDVSR